MVLPMKTKFVFGVCSFFLPDTPPQAKKKTSAGAIPGLDALLLFRDRPYLIFWHKCYGFAQIRSVNICCICVIRVLFWN